MKVWVEESRPLQGFLPLTATRRLAECAIGNKALGEWRETAFRAAGLQQAGSREEADFVVEDAAWLNAQELRKWADAAGAEMLVDATGAAVAWRAGVDIACPPDADGAVLRANESRVLGYVWDLLGIQENVLSAVTEDRIDGDLSEKATVEGVLVLGRGSRVLPGVFIEGVVVVGEDCRIGPNCYVRGSTAVGDRCRIGHSVEIKNSILMEDTWIGHLSYCGDSVIGARVNFGAGTIVSNYRHDGKEHRSMVGGVLVGTGREKFGTVMGDGVRTGVHTTIYPGRKLWPGVSTLPGQVVREDMVN